MKGNFLNFTSRRLTREESLHFFVQLVARVVRGGHKSTTEDKWKKAEIINYPITKKQIEYKINTKFSINS